MIGKTKRKFPHGGTYEGSFRAHQGFVQDDELKVQRHLGNSYNTLAASCVLSCSNVREEESFILFIAEENRLEDLLLNPL